MSVNVCFQTMCPSQSKFWLTTKSWWRLESITSTTVLLQLGRTQTHRKTHTQTHTNTYTHLQIQLNCTNHFLVVCFRCISCVTSEWDCQWNAQDHSCSDRDDAVDGDHIIKPQKVVVCVRVCTLKYLNRLSMCNHHHKVMGFK